MPNTITEQELEDLRVPELARGVTLVRARAIRPCLSGSACELQIEDVVGCVLSVEVVGWRVQTLGMAYSLVLRLAIGDSCSRSAMSDQRSGIAHSSLSAIVGASRDARRAGSQAATRLTALRRAAAATNKAGSQAFTPKNSVEA